jgi:exosortase family protein XrtF
MLKAFSSNPFLRFILISTSIYISWYITYEYYLKPKTHFDEIIIDGLVRTGEVVMRSTGFILTDYSSIDGQYRSHIGIVDSKGVTIGAPCDGAVLYALFICFVAAFPGNVRHKFWFIPIGAAAVYFINALRVVALAVIVNINEDWLAFNHDYTFTILVYAFVFFLWWLWVKKFSGTEVQNVELS